MRMAPGGSIYVDAAAVKAAGEDAAVLETRVIANKFAAAHTGMSENQRAAVSAMSVYFKYCACNPFK